MKLRQLKAIVKAHQNESFNVAFAINEILKNFNQDDSYELTRKDFYDIFVIAYNASGSNAGLDRMSKDLCLLDICQQCEAIKNYAQNPLLGHYLLRAFCQLAAVNLISFNHFNVLTRYFNTSAVLRKRVKCLKILSNKKLLNDKTIPLVLLYSIGDSCLSPAARINNIVKLAQFICSGKLTTNNLDLLKVFMLFDLETEWESKFLNIFEIGTIVTSQILSAFYDFTLIGYIEKIKHDHFNVRIKALECCFKVDKSQFLLDSATKFIAQLALCNKIGDPYTFCQKVIGLYNLGNLNASTLRELKTDARDPAAKKFLTICLQAGLLDECLDLLHHFPYTAMILASVEIIVEHEALTGLHLQRLKSDLLEGNPFQSVYHDCLKILKEAGLLARHGKECVDAIFTTTLARKDILNEIQRLKDNGLLNVKSLQVSLGGKLTAQQSFSISGVLLKGLSLFSCTRFRYEEEVEVQLSNNSS